MVYAMLMESDQCKDATDFKDTPLYKQCVAAGVIPDTSGPSPDMASGSIDGSPQDPAQDLSGTGADSPTDADHLLALNFQISNMWCPACAWVLENALVRSKGVVRASCNFSSDRGSLVYDPIKTSP